MKQPLFLIQLHRQLRLTNTARILVVLVASLVFTSSARLCAFEKFEIDIDRDSSLSPYRLLSTLENGVEPSRIPINVRARVLRPYISPSEPGLAITFRNGKTAERESATISKLDLPSWRGGDSSLRLTVTDWRIYRDSLLRRDMVCGCGQWNDTAWAFRFDPETGEKRMIFLLEIGNPATSASMSSSPMVNLVSDYDFDGMHEMIVYFDAGAHRKPRVLFSIKLESMELDWSLPMAAELVDNCVYDCRDSLNPAIILATNPSAQGVKDEEFSDSYGYLVKIDPSGNLLLKRIVTSWPFRIHFLAGNTPGQYFLAHNLETTDPDSMKDVAPDHSHFSRIDNFGNVLSTTQIEGFVAYVWMMPYDTLPAAIYMFLQDDVIRVYDDSLRLVAKSNLLDKLRTPKALFGRLNLPDRDDEVYVFESGIYSRDFQKLVAFPYGTVSYEVSGIDKDGNVQEIVLCGTGTYLVGRIERRSLIELLTILYIDYQKYVLIAGTALLVTLVLTNFYRSRTKRNLLMITQQKQEIERSHQEITEKNRALEKAYRDLENATEEIALQRARQAAAAQYRAASGQFRHEINNALGAVKIFISNVVHGTAGGGHRLQFEKRHQDLTHTLDRVLGDLPGRDPALHAQLLEQLTDLDTLDKRLMKGMDDIVLKGVERGLGLAERLRKYERIDHDDTFQPVALASLIDDVAQPSQALRQEAGIEFVNQLNADTVICGSYELLAILFRNLLDNSIDALRPKSSATRRIAVSSDQNTDNTVTIYWKDTGVGINPANFEKIFEPFYTEKPTTGSGLGLSMVRTIVEKYNGRISVTSVPGEYTTFSLVFRSA